MNFIDDKSVTADALLSAVIKTSMHSDSELIELCDWARHQFNKAASSEEENVFLAFERLLESQLRLPACLPRPALIIPTQKAGPKPQFENHCNHSDHEYAGQFDGGDIYFYLNHEEWHYCIRRSDELGGYTSGPIISMAHVTPVTYGYPASDEQKLESSDADLALLHHFFRHTQAHRVEKVTAVTSEGWRVFCDNETGDYPVPATSRVFSDEQAASDYCGQMAQGHNSFVVKMSEDGS